MAADIIFGNELHEDLDRWGNYTTLIELFEKLLPERFGGEPKLKGIQTLVEYSETLEVLTIPKER